MPLKLIFEIAWQCPNCKAELPMPLRKKKRFDKETGWNVIHGHTICVKCKRVIHFAATPEVYLEAREIPAPE